MKIHFYKYKATGNDFVMIDNRSGELSLSVEQIQKICDRKFGVGADGLMLIEKDPKLDFNLVYYNQDGSQSLCGNGSRAAMSFASFLNIVHGTASFNAYDGRHDATLGQDGIVRLKMNDTTGIKRYGEDLWIDTGAPHLMRFVHEIRSANVFEEGRSIRYSDTFKPAGTNANFVELLPLDQVSENDRRRPTITVYGTLQATKYSGRDSILDAEAFEIVLSGRPHPRLSFYRRNRV